MTTFSNRAAPVSTADQFDQITARLDQLRGDLCRAVRALPDRALPAVWALVTATDHMRQAAVWLDQATDQIDTADEDRADQAAPDDAWADPEWQVDSTTRTCCGGIGDHAHDCDPPRRPGVAAQHLDASHRSSVAVSAIPAHSEARQLDDTGAVL